MDWLSRFWGECPPPTSVSAYQGPSVLVSVDSLFPFHLSACAEHANEHIQTCGLKSLKSSTEYTQAGAGTDAIHASSIINLNNLYNEEMDILQTDLWIPRNIITYHVGCSLETWLLIQGIPVSEFKCRYIEKVS